MSVIACRLWTSVVRNRDQSVGGGRAQAFRCSGQGEKLCAGPGGGISDLISETQNDGTSTASFLSTLLSLLLDRFP